MNHVLGILGSILRPRRRSFAVAWWCGWSLILAVGYAQDAAVSPGAESLPPTIPEHAWSRFRGPNGSGLHEISAPPVDWTNSRVRWESPLAGGGHSSPIAWDQQLFVSSYRQDTESLVVAAIDVADGHERWVWTMPLARHPMHRLNSPATSTPAVDEQHIYVLAAEPEHLYLLALDHSGQMIWRRDFGTWRGQHGFATSPIVVGQNVVFLNSQESTEDDPRPTASRLIAVSCQRGETVWETPLAGERACYSVPAVLDGPQGTPQVIASTTGEGLFAVDALTGAKLWNERCFEQRTVGSPVIAGTSILGNNGSGGGGNYLVALEVVEGKPRIRYRLSQAIGYVPTVMVLREQLWVVGDNGVVSRFDLASGELHWKQRVAEGFWASPISDGRHVFLVDTRGTLFVLAAAQTPKVIHQIELAEACQATPALHAGHLFIRTDSKLVCVGVPPPRR